MQEYIKIKFWKFWNTCKINYWNYYIYTKFKFKIFGDKSLNKRSMKKLINLMSQFGAEFYPKINFFFLLTISFSSNYPIEYLITLVLLLNLKAL